MADPLLDPTAERSISVVARRHVCDDGVTQLTLDPGVNLVDVLEQARVKPELGPWLAVAVDGVLVERAHWLATEPPPGSFVTVAIVPRGGGGSGNKIIRIVALVAIAALSVAVPASLGLTGTFAGALIGAAIGVTAALTVNALVPPPAR